MAAKSDIPEFDPFVVSDPILSGFDFFWPHNLSITATRLNGINYAQWAKFVEIYFIINFWLITLPPPDRKEVGEAKYEAHENVGGRGPQKCTYCP